MHQIQKVSLSAEKDTDTVPILIFRIGSIRCAFFLDSVIQIFDAVDVGDFPEDPPPDVLGLINVRGLKVPLVDIRRRWGVPGGKVQLNHQLILIEAEGANVSIIVDEVVGTRNVPTGKVVHLGDILPVTNPHMAVADLAGILILIDADRLFSQSEFSAMFDWVERMIG